MKRSALCTAAVLATAVSVGLAVAAPATADPPHRDMSKRSGGQAFVQWTEYDRQNLLRLPGNVHIGYLGVYKMPGFSEVWGAIEDWQCDPGEVPGGWHGEEPQQPTCDPKGTRFLQAEPDAAYSVNVRSGVATLTGTIVVTNGGHGEPGTVLARVPANVVWTAEGRTYNFRRMDTWSDGKATYSSATRGSGFNATVSGSLGRMGFADDADDEASGNAEQWQERHRMRIRG